MSLSDPYFPFVPGSPSVLPPPPHGGWSIPPSNTESNTEYGALSGKPYITVSPISGSKPNNGADYGPDTSGTTTSGIQEAIESIYTTGGTIYLLPGTFICSTPIAAVFPQLSGQSGYTASLNMIGSGALPQGGIGSTHTYSSSQMGSIIQYTGTESSPILGIGFDVGSSSGAQGALCYLSNFHVNGNGNESGGIVIVNSDGVSERISTANISGSFCFRWVGGGGEHDMYRCFIQSAGNETSNFDCIHITGQDKFSTYTIGSTTLTVYGRPEGAIYDTRYNANISAPTGSNLNGIHIDDANNFGFYNVHGTGEDVGLYIDSPNSWSGNPHSMYIYGSSMSLTTDAYIEADGTNTYTIISGGNSFNSGLITGNAPILYLGGGVTSSGLSILGLAGLGGISAVGYNKLAGEGGGSSPTSVSVGSSPFTYTNNTGYDIQVHIASGTVSSITLNGTTVFSGTGHTVILRPSDSIVITYTSAPTVVYIPL